MDRKLKRLLAIIISITIAGSVVMPLNGQTGLAKTDAGLKDGGNVTDEAEDPGYTDVEINQDEIVDPESKKQTVKKEKVVSIVKPLSLTKKKKGIFVYWGKIRGAERYVIFRKTAVSKKWKRLYHKDALNSFYWMDDKEKISGETYEYLVAGCTVEKKVVKTSKNTLRKMKVPKGTEGRSTVWVPAAKVRKFVRMSGGKWRVRWNPVEGADGYRIEYSKDKLFIHSKAVNVNGGSSDVYTLKPKNKKAKYYVRMTARKKAVINGKTRSAYSAPSYSSNIRKTNVAPPKYRKEKRTFWVTYWTGKYKKKKYRYRTKRGKKKVAIRKIKIYKKKKVKRKVIIDYRSKAGQRTYGYDTIQGGCTDDKYEYQILQNKGNNRCRIIKIRLRNGKIVKRSRPLKLHHGNDITYNSRKKYLVAVHYTGKPKAVTIISRKTLKPLKTVRVRLKKSIYGASKKRLKKIKSFTGIAYDAASGHYIMGMEGSLNYLELSSGFEPRRFIQSNGEKNRINQGIECTGKYILRVQTKYGGYDSIEVRDMDGHYLTRINLTRSFEVENIYMAGSRLRGGTYANYGSSKKGYVFRVSGY